MPPGGDPRGETLGRIAYANIAARQLLSEGKSLTGLLFSEALAECPGGLRDVFALGDALISAEIDGVEESFHCSQRAFILQGRGFSLFLFRRLTRELSRQEVSTWKKLIRVLSHELNNSLGPLSSLARTGAEMARRGDHALPARGVCGHRRTFDASARLRRRLFHVFKLPAPRPGATSGQLRIRSRATACLLACGGASRPARLV